MAFKTSSIERFWEKVFNLADDEKFERVSAGDGLELLVM